MKKLFYFVLLIFISFNVNAELFNCALPDKREGGEPLSISEIKEVRFYYGVDDDFQKDGKPFQVNENITPFEISNVCQVTIKDKLPTGNWSIVFSVCDTENRCSLYSDVMNVTIDKKPPLAGRWILNDF